MLRELRKFFLIQDVPLELPTGRPVFPRQSKYLRAILPDRSESDVLDHSFPLGGDVRDVLLPRPVLKLLDRDPLLLPVPEVILDLRDTICEPGSQDLVFTFNHTYGTF